MKITVFSDTHGHTGGMLRAIRAAKPDAVFHLGDYERDIRCVREAFPALLLCSVSGNCDSRPENPDTAVFTVGGVRIFASHGHRYGVKYALDALLNAGYFSNAGLILFGHTHVAMHEELEGTHILNPGSAGMGARCTYGLITIEDGQVVSCAVLPVPVS